MGCGSISVSGGPPPEWTGWAMVVWIMLVLLTQRTGYRDGPDGREPKRWQIPVVIALLVSFIAFLAFLCRYY